MRSVLWLIGTLLALNSGDSHAVYRCEQDGVVSYGDMPCADGKRLDLRLAPADSEAALRATREKNQLAEIERAARQVRKQKMKEARRAEQRAEAQRRRCEKLALRVQWAQQDAQKAGNKSRDKAELRARRDAELYRLECGPAPSPGLTLIAR